MVVCRKLTPGSSSVSTMQMCEQRDWVAIYIAAYTSIEPSAFSGGIGVLFGPSDKLFVGM